MILSDSPDSVQGWCWDPNAVLDTVDAAIQGAGGNREHEMKHSENAERSAPGHNEGKACWAAVGVFAAWCMQGLDAGGLCRQMC